MRRRFPGEIVSNFLLSNNISRFRAMLSAEESRSTGVVRMRIAKQLAEVVVGVNVIFIIIFIINFFMGVFESPSSSLSSSQSSSSSPCLPSSSTRCYCTGCLKPSTSPLNLETLRVECPADKAVLTVLGSQESK